MEEKMEKDKFDQYKDAYNEQSLMTKISRFAKKAGLNTTYYVLLLYNMIISRKISLADKAVVVGALGYFISPLDVIPDVILGTGFLDDASILVLALGTVVNSITPSIKDEAKKSLHKWFDFNEEELDVDYR
jgi:uncharacterized membrane protein YkvA (DUF1232 family)